METVTGLRLRKNFYDQASAGTVQARVHIDVSPLPLSYVTTSTLPYYFLRLTTTGLVFDGLFCLWQIRQSGTLICRGWLGQTGDWQDGHSSYTTDTELDVSILSLELAF